MKPEITIIPFAINDPNIKISFYISLEKIIFSIFVKMHNDTDDCIFWSKSLFLTLQSMFICIL
jgi:hypothetical protein